MKTLLSILCLALLSPFTFAQSEEKQDLAERLLEAMDQKGTYEKLMAAAEEQFGKMAAQMGATQMGSADAIWDSVVQEMSWDQLKSDFVQIYADAFSEDELEGLIGFFKSELGKVYSQKYAQVAQETQAIIQQKMQRAIQQSVMEQQTQGLQNRIPGLPGGQND